MAEHGGRQGHLHDGLGGRVQALQHGLTDLHRQLVAHRADGVAHLVGGLDHVLVEVEDHHQARKTFAGGGLHPVDTSNALQRLFDAVDDLALHRVGRCTRVGDAHGEHRLLDVRDLVDPQLAQGEQAQRHQGDDDDHHRDRPLDAEFREEHGAPFFSCWQLTRKTPKAPPPWRAAWQTPASGRPPGLHSGCAARGRPRPGQPAPGTRRCVCRARPA